MPGKVIAVCTSNQQGMQKQNINEGTLKKEWGLEGDAHASTWHRQLSLLAIESIEKIRQQGLEVGPGDFAENITTEGIDLVNLPIGTNMQLGETLLEVTQIGKECHDRCAVYYQAGDCVMPREGIFARVLRGGNIKTGDTIEVVS